MSRETIIHLYRHGQSEKNLYTDIVGGRCHESPLTERGVKQARKLGAYIGRLPSPDALYSSIAFRAVQTSMYARSEAGLRHLSIIETPWLQEVTHGDWEGRNKYEPLVLADGSTEEYKKLRDRGLDGKVSGSESVREAGSRMVNEISELARRHSGGRIMIFSHAGALRSAAAHLTGDFNYLDKKVPFVSETTFAFDGKLHLEEASFATPTIEEIT